jgi:Do/DeqQ family serine protease
MNTKKIIGLFLVALMGGAAALGLSSIIKKEPRLSSSVGPTVPVRQVGFSPVAGNLPDFEAAASISVHAVVHIKTEFLRKSVVYDDFFDFFNFGQPRLNERYTPLTGMGSGVIISPDGYIVTNNHVVQEAREITVTLNDKREYKATIVGTDPSTDLAVIRIDETNLPYLTYGNSDDVKIGEWVLAVGNPFNLTSTVTAGIVSAKARNINILGSQGAIESFIQTDAAVNPGNSGGALVNTTGELIGINAAIASGTGYYTGYSFAIPVNIVKKVVSDFTRFGKIQRGYLGITYSEIDDQFAKEKGLQEIKGIYVVDVLEGGAAEKAGIRKGDVIVKLSATPVNSKSELLEVIGQHNPGDQLGVMVNRDGKEVPMTLVLKSEDEQVAVTRDDKLIIHGATFEPLTGADMDRYGLKYGFKITRLENGKLRNAGIREGFMVVSVDRKPVRTMDELKNALSSGEGGVLIEGIYPNGLRAYYGIGL